MGNDSNPVKLAGTATTTLGSVFLYSVSINKTLTGTLVVEDGTNVLANFASTTPPGDYHNLPSGARYQNLQCILSAGDDVTVFVKKA